MRPRLDDRPTEEDVDGVRDVLMILSCQVRRRWEVAAAQLLEEVEFLDPDGHVSQSSGSVGDLQRLDGDACVLEPHCDPSARVHCLKERPDRSSCRWDYAGRVERQGDAHMRSGFDGERHGETSRIVSCRRPSRFFAAASVEEPDRQGDLCVTLLVEGLQVEVVDDGECRALVPLRVTSEEDLDRLLRPVARIGDVLEADFGDVLVANFGGFPMIERTLKRGSRCPSSSVAGKLNWATIWEANPRPLPRTEGGGWRGLRPRRW